MRLTLSRYFQRRLYSGIHNETLERTKTSAIVFAPHQDDETLGCGGTMILKRQAGAPVACVFMTDGSTSHRAWMEEEELRLLRRAEAMRAAAVLGLSAEDVHFLDHPDGKLARFHATAVSTVLDLLERYRPEEVYVPYHEDGVRDHEATQAIVREAAKQAGRAVEICEYPVWSWNQWPWVPLWSRGGGNAGASLLRNVRAGLGLRLFRDCTSGVFVGDLLERKRSALEQYRSQMTILRPGTAWPTLQGVSGGAFLKCFFGDYEIFCCNHVPGLGDDP